MGIDRSCDPQLIITTTGYSNLNQILRNFKGIFQGIGVFMVIWIAITAMVFYGDLNLVLRKGILLLQSFIQQFNHDCNRQTYHKNGKYSHRFQFNFFQFNLFQR